MHGQRIGYIWVSTLDQSAVRQLEALLSYVRAGDTLVVHSMIVLPAT